MCQFFTSRKLDCSVKVVVVDTLRDRQFFGIGYASQAKLKLMERLDEVEHDERFL